MATFENLRDVIDQYITDNGNKEITGTILNEILQTMVTALGANYQVAGVATPSTNPGQPEQKVVYLASQAGTYTNFDAVVLPLGIHLLMWDGTSWSHETFFSVDDEPTAGSDNLVKSGGVAIETGHTSISDITISVTENPSAGYVNYNTRGISDTTYWRHSTPIHLNIGDMIVVSNWAIGGSGVVTVIAETTSDERYYVPKVPSRGTENPQVYSYVAEKETYVVISFQNGVAYGKVNIIKSGLIQGISRASSNSLTALMLFGRKEVEDITNSIINNKITGYINATTGGISGTGSFYWHSDVFDVDAGTCIVVENTDTQNSGIAAIAKYNQSTNKYECLVAGETGGRKSFSYIVTETGKYAVSFKNGFGQAYLIKNTYTIAINQNLAKEVSDKAEILSKINYIENNPVYLSLDNADLVRESVCINSGGNIAASANSIIYAFKNVNAKKLSAYLGNYTGVLDIAFYSKCGYKEIKSDNLIGSVPSENGLALHEDVNIPNGCKMIVFSHRIVTYGDVAWVKIYGNYSSSKIAQTNDIITNNPDISILLNSLNKKYYGGGAYGNDIVSFLHFSDIHADTICLERILKFYNFYSDSISDIIHTGDSVADKYVDGFDWWSEVGADKVLNVIGNHDTNYNGSWTGAAGVMAYDRYFKPYISQWGVTQPADAEANGYCYYYKDYNSNVRLIVLDCMAWNSTQKIWFESVLADARQNELSVIVADHKIGFAMEHTSDCTFDSLDLNAQEPISSEAPTAVQSFINAGGKFICWICGHLHNDFFGVGTEYSGQLCICVGTAQWGQAGQMSLVVRSRFDKSEDLFNIIGIDTTKTEIKLIRVGADRDRLLRHIGTLAYNYQTKTLLYND